MPSGACHFVDSHLVPAFGVVWCSHVLQVGLKSESTRVQLEFMLGSGGVEVAGQLMSDATVVVPALRVLLFVKNV